MTSRELVISKWSRRDSNPGPNTAIVKPSTCLAGLNFRGQKAVRRTWSDPYLLKYYSEIRSPFLNASACLTPLNPLRQRLAGEGCGLCVIYSEIRQPWHTKYCQLLFGRFFKWRPSTNSIHAYTRNGVMPSKPVGPITCNLYNFNG